MIRPATLADVPAIIWLLDLYMQKYPVRRDIDKIKKVLNELISGPSHFAYVVENEHPFGEGEIDGVLLGMTGNNLWAQRQHCGVLAWVSYSAGEGAALLRKFRDWVKDRRAIKVAGMAPDLDMDSRVWTLAERIGFEKRGGSLLMFN